MNSLDRQAAEWLAAQIRQEPWVLRVQVLPIGEETSPTEALPHNHYSCWITWLAGCCIIVDVQAWEHWKRQISSSPSLPKSVKERSIYYKGIRVTLKNFGVVRASEDESVIAAWCWDGCVQQVTAPSSSEAFAAATQNIQAAILLRRDGGVR